jgi:hypothetical protein
MPFGLPVCFSSMPYGQDLKGVPEVVESDAVVSDAKAVFLRVRIPQQLDVAFPDEEEACQALQHPHGGFAVDAADVGAGRIGPLNPFSHEPCGGNPPS